MAKIFFSYCHRDEELRNELEKHLSILKRQGQIEAWHDRKIEPGTEIDSEIDKHLESANLILLLISPDFLSSDYCYEKEMTRALERHEDGKAKVIPIILEFCDWHPAPFGKLNALPKDGKPIRQYTNPNEAFTEITEEIRKLVSSNPPKVSSGDSPPICGSSPSPIPTANIRSSNLRVKKSFSDREKDDFIEKAFDYIAIFFENSLKKLDKRNDHLECKFKKIDANHFCAYIYEKGQQKSQCKIWLDAQYGAGFHLNFSRDASPVDNSFNESMSIVDDGYSLFLQPIGMAHLAGSNQQLSFEGAAEYFWEMLLQYLQ
jgi:hypothetical protein